MQFAGRLDGNQIDLVLEKPALELADAFVRNCSPCIGDWQPVES
jgi:hypothetical protein